MYIAQRLVIESQNIWDKAKLLHYYCEYQYPSRIRPEQILESLEVSSVDIHITLLAISSCSQE